MSGYGAEAAALQGTQIGRLLAISGNWTPFLAAWILW